MPSALPTTPPTITAPSTTTSTAAPITSSAPPMVHSTASVHPEAELGTGVEVGPYCVVGPRAKLGKDTRLISHVCVMGRTTLGDYNTVWPFVTLGADPQDLKFKGEDSQLILGDHNDIRENVTIHKGTAADQGLTRLGDHNLVMAYTHIGHDCVIGSHVILTNAVQLAGHIAIEDHASIGGASAVHHFCTIGQYAYIGGMTRIVHDVPPFMFIEGNPARTRGVNQVGLRRHAFSEETEQSLKDAWKRLFRQQAENGVGQTAQSLTELEEAYPDDWAIKALVASIRRSNAGVYGRHREVARRHGRYTAPVR